MNVMNLELSNIENEKSLIVLSEKDMNQTYGGIGRIRRWYRLAISSYKLEGIGVDVIGVD